MKALLTALAVVACGTAVADPVGQRTPNGGFEYYSNHHPNQGTVENGCILPWRYAGFPTLGYNPKRIDMGDATEFVDCKIPHVKKVHHQPAPVVVPAPAPAPAPMPAPVPAPAPAMDPVPVPLPIRE